MVVAFLTGTEPEEAKSADKRTRSDGGTLEDTTKKPGTFQGGIEERIRSKSILPCPFKTQGRI